MSRSVSLHWKQSHETAMDNLEEEHQKQIDDLNKSKSIESFAFWLFDDDNLDHRLQCEQFKDNLDQKEQLILKTV